MRSQGQVRFIKISSRVQMTAAGVVAALLAVWLVSMAAMAISSFVSTRDRLALLDREAKVASSESRLNAYGNDIGKVADDLKRRQDFIEKTSQSVLGDLPHDAKAGETVSDSASEAAKTVKKVSMAVPQAAELARIEARQLALIEGMTRLADRRSAMAEAKLTRLGLNPRAMLASLDDRSAQGGPQI
ncbi:MAG: M23 family peptidase, partial [Sphingomonadales bacterium]|nr:M23 family peptidase [Sphingomonadales bacterium]